MQKNPQNSFVLVNNYKFQAIPPENELCDFK